MDYVQWRRNTYARIMDDFRRTVNSVESLGTLSCMTNGECQLRVRDVSDPTPGAPWTMLSDLTEQNTDPPASNRNGDTRQFSFEVRSQESQSLQNNILLGALGETSAAGSHFTDRQATDEMLSETYNHSSANERNKKHRASRKQQQQPPYNHVAAMHLTANHAAATTTQFHV